ncbi:MAG TPA: acyltransferase [Chthoniobacterales bacterium]
MQATKRLIGLDAIRAIAILLVVLTHYLGFYFGITGRWCWPLGVLGVEMFFVLSGYLIGGILLDVIAKNNGRLTPPVLLNFWMRRWFRTIPNYLLFLAIFIVGFHRYDPKEIATYLTFTQNLFHPVPGFFDISWSLAVEEWFYLLFPISILLFSVTNWRMRYKVLAATAVLFICPLVLRIVYGPGLEWDSGVRKIVVMRLDALMWGVLVAAMKRYAPAYFQKLQSPKFFGAGLVLLITLLLSLNMKFKPAEDFIATWADAFWFSGFSLSVALMMPFCVAIRSLPLPLSHVAMRISLWSYSMYLCHEPVMFVTKKLFHELPRGFLIAITSVVILAVSALLYHFFEVPMLRLRDKGDVFRKFLPGFRRQSGNSPA